MNAPALAAATRPAPAFSTELMTRLEAASRVLLSPLASGDVDLWRADVMHTMCELLGAETASFHFPGRDRPHLTRGMDDTAGHTMDVFLGPAWGNLGPGPDPMLDLFCQIAGRLGLESWDNASADAALGGGGASRRSAFWNEVAIPLGTQDSQVLFVQKPQGSFQLSIHGLRCPPEPGEHISLLRVLLPSFKVGLDALTRLDAHRAALDAVEEPVAIFNADGAEVHRNRSLTMLLACDAEAAQIDRALARLAFQMRALGFPLRGERAGIAVPGTIVQTARTRYTLRATLLPPGTYGDAGALLVSVTPAQEKARFPSPDDLRARFNLTKREAETALLVAQGLSNDTIAERLFVSRHTVRHHVESLTAKMDLSGKGRGAVAARLIQLDIHP